MEKDLYKILGVDKDASDAEIKKAYRKLAIKYHPDKQSDKTPEEQKIAAEKMAEINAAYETLSNKESRIKYDSGGVSFDDIFGKYGGDPFGNPFGGSPFGGFGGFGGFSNWSPYDHSNSTVYKGSSIQMRIPIDIESLLNGYDHVIHYKKKQKCHSCNGVGGSKRVSCPHCHGMGYIQSMEHPYPGYTIAVNKQCPHCGGKGYKIEHICPHCHGTGEETTDVELKIHFDPGVIEGDSVVYSGQGNEYIGKENGIPGDFIATPYYNIDRNIYDISNLPDIKQIIPVDWIDALGGCDTIIKIPGKNDIKLKIPEGTINGQELYGPTTYTAQRITSNWDGTPGYPQIVTGRFIFKIKYNPVTITDEQKEILKQLKKTKKKQ